MVELGGPRISKRQSILLDQLACGRHIQSGQFLGNTANCSTLELGLVDNLPAAIDLAIREHDAIIRGKISRNITKYAPGPMSRLRKGVREEWTGTLYYDLRDIAWATLRP